MLGLKLGLDMDKLLAGGIPSASDALFWLDGTLSGSEFVDKTGNGRNFTITGKDFTASYFPYKSAATISAPAGDATLIAADVNNFLYASGGTPNEIPVVSFFQNIDYEDIGFSRHVAQTVNGSGVETQEPYVTDIVWYASALTGADLTTANTYYGVPTFDASAKWVSEGGNDTTGDGSRLTPWATLTKAITVAGAKIYVPTGTITEPDFANLNRTVEVIGIGRSIWDAIGASYTISLPADANVVSVTGFTIVGSFSDVFATAGTTNKTFSRCSMLDATSRSLWNGANAGVTLQYCIIAQVINLYSGLIIDTSFIYKGNSTIISPSSAGTSDFLCKNSKLVGLILGTSGTGKVTFLGNDIDGRLTVTTGSSLDFLYNTVDYSLTAAQPVNISIPCTVTGNVINNTNVLTTHDALKIDTVDCTVTENIITTAAAAAINIQGDDATSVDASILNNIAINTNTDGYGIRVGQEGTSTRDTGINAVIKNNAIYGKMFTSPATDISTMNSHGLFVGHTADYDVRYNRVNGMGIGIIIKGSGESYTDQLCQYNDILDNNIQIMIKGAEDVALYGNVLTQSFDNSLRGITVIENAVGVGSINVSLKNTIIEDDNTTPPFAVTWDAASKTIASVNDIDNNNYYVPGKGANPITHPDYATFALWQAAGYDANTILTDPELTDGIPDTGSPTIGAGETLAAAYDDGLDESTNWGSETTVPTVVTKQQTAPWDIGAYVS